MLGTYLDAQEVLVCPLGSGEVQGATTDDRAGLPIFYCCYGAARMGRCFTQWGHYDSGRDWLKGVANPKYPATTTPPRFPYTVESNPDQWGYGGIELTPDLLVGYSQVWILPTIALDIPGPNTAHLPAQSEQDALKAFVMSRGSVHLRAVDNPDGVRFMNAVGAPASMTGTVPKCGTYKTGDHEVMAGVAKLGANYNQTQMRLELNRGSKVIGVKTNDVTGVVAYDTGSGRVLVNHAIDCTMVYLPYYDFCTDDYDFKRYCINAANWLNGSYATVATCSYGYNNQLGKSRGRPGNDTILLLDYCDWEADRDGTDDDHDNSYIALRHGGRANALLYDGRVEPMSIEDIGPGMWTPTAGD